MIEITGTILIFIGLCFHILPALYYLWLRLDYYISLHLDATPTQLPSPLRLLPFWVGLPWIGSGVFNLIIAHKIRRSLSKNTGANLSEEEIDQKKELKNKKLAYIFIVIFTTFALLHQFFPQYIPKMPFVSDKSNLDLWVENQIDIWEKENPSIQELVGDHIENKEMKISFERPMGWHVYIGESKKHHGIVIRKEATDGNAKGLEDSAYMIILNLGSVGKRPAGPEATLIEKGLKEMFPGFRLRKKEIITIGDLGAIRIEGIFEKGGKQFRVVSYLRELNGENCLAYGVAEADQELDQKAMESVAKQMTSLQ